MQVGVLPVPSWRELHHSAQRARGNKGNPLALHPLPIIGIYRRRIAVPGSPMAHSMTAKFGDATLAVRVGTGIRERRSRSMDVPQLTRRMVRAACLDPEVHEEAEAGSGALLQALLVVLGSSVAAGIAVIPHGGLGFILTNALLSLLLWHLWAFLIYWIGTHLWQEGTTSSHGRAEGLGRARQVGGPGSEVPV